MQRNIKFIPLFVVLFLTSCGTQNNSVSSKSDIEAPYSDTNDNFKYNSMYNKLVVELLLHKNQDVNSKNSFVLVKGVPVLHVSFFDTSNFGKINVDLFFVLNITL